MGWREWLGFSKPRDAPDVELPKIEDNVRDSGGVFVFGMTNSGERVDEKSALQIATVYACVRLLAETIASLPLHLYRFTEKGDGKERATDHPLYKILYRQANPEMTSFSFREAMMMHLLLWGNAYAQIVRDGKNGILGLYPLLPENVEIDRAENGDLFYTYHAYTDEVPGEHNKDIIFQRDEILHIPGLGFADEILFENKKNPEEDPDEKEPDQVMEEAPDEEEKGGEEKEKPRAMEDAIWQFSSRLMGETILNRLGAKYEPSEQVTEPESTGEKLEPPEAGLTEAPVEDKPDMLVIGMDGKTKDGAMPYEILKEKLEWLK